MQKQNKKKFKTAMLSVLLVGVMVATGIGAYFTATDTKTNVFTVGNVDIELQEPNWENNYPTTPNETVKKDPQIKNIGDQDAYVYMTVDMPYATVVIADADGNKSTSAETELFTYTVNDNWVEVGTAEKVTADSVYRHVYAYVGIDNTTLEALSATTTTSALFEEIKFANVVETPETVVLEGTDLNIVINAYGIEINIIGGEETPEYVWEIITNQVIEAVIVPVTAKDADGNDLNASAKNITGKRADELLASLEASNLATADEVDALIEVKSDNFEGMANTTFDVSKIAKEGDKVVILHYDETAGKWEYITTDTVDGNLTVSGNFSSYSPVAFVVLSDLKPGLYSEDGDMIRTWEQLTDLEYAKDISSLDSPILNVDANGVLTTNYDGEANGSNLYLIGKLVISNCVTEIGKDAFSDCRELTEVIIPESVIKIGEWAFGDCVSIKTIDIPKSVISISSSAFINTSNILNIKVDSKNPVYDSRNNCNAIVETKTNTLIKGCENTVIPDSVTSIGESAFQGCSNLTSIIIPNSIQTIGKNAFYLCSNLTSMTIPNSVTNIGEWAFANCKNLRTIYIPNSIEIIGRCAFSQSYKTLDIYCGASEEQSEWGDRWNDNAMSTNYGLTRAEYEALIEK